MTRALAHGGDLAVLHSIIFRVTTCVENCFRQNSIYTLVMYLILRTYAITLSRTSTYIQVI